MMNTIWQIQINFWKGISLAGSVKNEKLRGKQAKFMTKEPRKAIMDRSKFKNKSNAAKCS